MYMISPHRDLLDIRQLYTLTKAIFVMMMLMISNFHLHGTENHLDSPSSKHYGHYKVIENINAFCLHIY